MADLGRVALKTAGQTLGLNLSDNQLKPLGRYAGLLREWNRRTNLISRRDENRILAYHVIDSLAASSFIPADSRVADIGTGAGLPGIPLSIARPDLEMLLVESSHRKCLFLETAVRELELGNARVVEGRAESLEPLRCVVVLSRLTGPLRQLVKQVHYHLVPGGRLVLFKTAVFNQELTRAAKLLSRYNLEVARTFDVTLPISGIPRRFVVLTRLAA